MNLYQWLCLLSVPALLLAGLKHLLNQIKGVRMGVKALLRANMISEYETWHERGFAPLYAKQNFENLWVQYHAIKGPNGVMDDLHTKFLALPTERHERGE
jgi:hypothetical protein